MNINLTQNYSAVRNQPSNSRFKNEPNFQGITIRQGLYPNETSKIIPQEYIGFIMNSPEMKKAGEVYNIVVSAFGSRLTEITHTSIGLNTRHTSTRDVIVPHLSFSISEKTFGNKIREIARFCGLSEVEKPRVYKMSFNLPKAETTFNKVKHLTKADIDAFVQQRKENDKKMQALLAQPKEKIIKVK